jgi:hypothetical protein
VDHRLEKKVEERDRVTASGGEVSRLNLFGRQEVEIHFTVNCKLQKKMHFRMKQ